MTLLSAGSQMSPTKLPPEHNIVRNVPWGKLRKDENDPERVIGILGEAFRMRPNDEALSATWMEYFAGSRQDKIFASIRAMRASNLKIAPKSGFAVGNVGKIATVAAARGHTIRVLHEPEDDNLAHAVVRRLPREDMALLEELATDAWSEIVLNADESIPKGAERAPDQAAWAPHGK